MPNIIKDKPCKPCEEQLLTLYKQKREELRTMNIPLPQNEKEFESLCVTVGRYKPKTFVEIGTRDGGSLWMLSQFCAPKARVVSIDLIGGAWGKSDSWKNRERVVKNLREQGFAIGTIDGDSHNPEVKEYLTGPMETKSIDLLFLDGDHTFRGVLRDWELYHPLVRRGGMVAFHDINDCRLPRCKNVNVHFLWRTLKTIYRHEEYVADPSNIFGIGVLWK